MATRAELEKYLTNPNVQAFLGLLRDTEGTAKGKDPYRVYGGSPNKQLADLSKAPDFQQWSFKQTDGKSNSSSATGAYQFLGRTWNALAKQYGLTDFTPKSQDIAAVALLAQNGSLNDIVNGDFASAVQKSNKTWASLPGSPYNQHTRSMEYVQNSLSKHLGEPVALGKYEAPDPKPKQPTALSSLATDQVQTADPVEKVKLMSEMWNRITAPFRHRM